MFQRLIGGILAGFIPPDHMARRSAAVSTVLRFTPETLHAKFGADFAKVGSTTEMHTTPWGSEQEFVYCYCRLAD